MGRIGERLCLIVASDVRDTSRYGLRWKMDGEKCMLGGSRQLVVVRIAWKRNAYERGNKKKQKCQATMRSEDPLAAMGNCTFLFRAKTDCGIKL